MRLEMLNKISDFQLHKLANLITNLKLLVMISKLFKEELKS